jgi:glycosyltransferase involved in cell wall biosynthesis
MNSNSKISIITSVFNGAETIEDCIKSVLRQTYSNIEHIIIDGGSTDGTIDIINKYQDKISKWISEPDNGIYDAMNKGIALSTGGIIGFLNADDVYADNMVLKQVASVFAEPAIDACYADLVYVDRFNLNKTIRYWKSCDFKDNLFNKGWIPPHPTFFVRRNIYDKFGNFDLDYRLAADYELMLRFLVRYKIRSVYIPKIFVKMRVGGATNKNITNRIKQNIEIYQAGKKNHVSISPIFFIPKIVDRISQFLKRPAK